MVKLGKKCKPKYIGCNRNLAKQIKLKGHGDICQAIPSDVYFFSTRLTDGIRNLNITNNIVFILTQSGGVKVYSGGQ